MQTYGVGSSVVTLMAMRGVSSRRCQILATLAPDQPGTGTVIWSEETPTRSSVGSLRTERAVDARRPAVPCRAGGGEAMTTVALGPFSRETLASRENGRFGKDHAVGVVDECIPSTHSQGVSPTR